MALDKNEKAFKTPALGCYIQVYWTREILPVPQNHLNLRRNQGKDSAGNGRVLFLRGVFFIFWCVIFLKIKKPIFEKSFFTMPNPKEAKIVKGKDGKLRLENSCPVL
jgi:hypothetical protein